MPLDFDAVRAIAREFPDLTEGTTYGTPAIMLGKRMVACIPSHRSAEPASLAVRTSFEEREALLAEQPDTYYVKEHYRNHPVVLVRFANVRRDELHGLIAAARRFILSTVNPVRPKAKRATRRIP